MAKKRIFAGRVGPIKYFFDENGNVVDQTGAVAPRAIAAAILAGIESIPEVKVEDKAPTTPKAPEKEEGRLSRVTQKVSSGRGSTRGTMGNIADVISRGTIAASVGSVPDLRGVAAATLDAAGVGEFFALGGGGGGGGRRSAASTSGGGKNPGKESVGILESILNVLQDNNELLQDLLSSLTAAAKGRIEAEREANRKSGEAGKGVRDEGEDPEKQSFLGKWGTIIAAALGSVYGIIQGWLKTVKYFAEALLPESLIKSIKGKFAAIGTFFDDIFIKLKSVFSGRFEKIGAAFEEVFSKITNLFKGVGEESKLGKIISSIGGAITRLAAPFIEAFETIKTITSGPASKIGTVFESIGGFFGKFSGIFEGVSSTAGKMMGFLDSFAGIFKFVSNIVSKLALPLMIVMTVWDTVKEMIAGYEKEGIVGAIAGAVTGFFNSLIFGPLDMLKSAVAWVLGKFGFENAEKELNSFSFSEMFTNLIGTVKDFFIDIGKWVGEKMAGASVSFNEWWDSWSISGALIEKVKVFFIDIGKWVSEKMAGASVSFNEWWASWSITGAITTAFEDFKQKIINYFGPEFVAKIGEIANFDLAGYISKKIGEVFKTITDFFAAIPGIIGAFVTDQIKKLPGGEALLNALKPATTNFATGASGSFGGPAAQRNLEERTASVVPDTQKIEPRPDGWFDGENSKNEWDAKYKGKYDPITGEKLVQTSANFGNSMADLMPIENPTAPAFLKRANDIAVSDSAPAAPIIIDNSTKNNVTNSRPSSISPRVSSGAPSTAPVMSHIDRFLYPFIGAYP